jgi:serine/threonine protein kinase
MPPDPLISSDGRPVRFGDYLIHRQIGEGGMARVYEGEEIMSRRRVAIKVLRTELAHSPQIRRHFLTEMGILANLDDPNIVRCLLCSEIEGHPVMVLELLDGWTLRAMLHARVALPWAEVARYAVQIAKALRTAHSCSPPIVHRDLKPENVMVLRDGRVKVMDFGIAKFVQSVRGTTNHDVGTPQYMSPEQIDAQAVDGRADLFALGLVMWEMLAGHPPFVGESPRVLLERICAQPAPRLPDHARQGLPPALETLVFRLLEKDPRARPAHASEVVALLEQWTSTVVLPPASAPQQVQHSTPPRDQNQFNTLDIVEQARKGSAARSVEEAEEIVSQFARATSASIVRMLVGLLALPAAATVFVGVPLLLAVIGVGLLDQDGVDLQSTEATWLTPEFGIATLVVIVVVFVRACWAHRRAPSESRIRGPWLLLGFVLNAGWVASTAIELAPGNALNPELHAFFIITCFLWLTVSMSWVTGRIASRLFRRLEQPHAAH